MYIPLIRGLTDFEIYLKSLDSKMAVEYMDGNGDIDTTVRYYINKYYYIILFSASLNYSNALFYLSYNIIIMIMYATEVIIITQY